MISIFVSVNRTAKYGMKKHTKEHGLNSGSIMLSATQIQLHLYRSMCTNSSPNEVTSVRYGSMQSLESEKWEVEVTSLSLSTKYNGKITKLH
jgi:hypothetical protein